MAISRLLKILKKIESLPLRLWIKLRTKRYKGKVHYLFVNNHSNSIMVVFSAFTGNTRKFNYIRSLRGLKFDKLFIMDDFGYTGSYNMYENGQDYPEKLTFGVLDLFLSNGKYEHVYTMGSSKGGTGAIYFGLPYNVDAIYTGACQYNLGSYLHREDHEKIFLSMMGEGGDLEAKAKVLNEKLPNQLEKYKANKTVVHVYFSKKELTYERQIVDLLNKLKELNMNYKEIECDAPTHEDVGVYMIQYLRKVFNF